MQKLIKVELLKVELFAEKCCDAEMLPPAALQTLTCSEESCASYRRGDGGSHHKRSLLSGRAELGVLTAAVTFGCYKIFSNLEAPIPLASPLLSYTYLLLLLLPLTSPFSFFACVMEVKVDVRPE